MHTCVHVLNALAAYNLGRILANFILGIYFVPLGEKKNLNCASHMRLDLASSNKLPLEVVLRKKLLMFSKNFTLAMPLQKNITQAQ